jgi:hypothetical protein
VSGNSSPFPSYRPNPLLASTHLSPARPFTTIFNCTRSLSNRCCPKLPVSFVFFFVLLIICLLLLLFITLVRLSQLQFLASKQLLSIQRRRLTLCSKQFHKTLHQLIQFILSPFSDPAIRPETISELYQTINLITSSLSFPGKSVIYRLFLFLFTSLLQNQNPKLADDLLLLCQASSSS